MMQLLDLGHGYFVEKRGDGDTGRRELWILYRRRHSKVRRSGMYLPLSTATSHARAKETLSAAGAPQATLDAFEALQHAAQTDIGGAAMPRPH